MLVGDSYKNKNKSIFYSFAFISIHIFNCLFIIEMINKEEVIAEFKKYNLFDNITEKERIGLLSVNKRLNKDDKGYTGLSTIVLKHLYNININEDKLIDIIVDIYNYFEKIINFLNKKINSSSSSSSSSSSRSSSSSNSLSSVSITNSMEDIRKYKDNKIDLEKISKRKFNTIIDFVIYLLNKNIYGHKFKLQFKGINRQYYVIEDHNLKNDTKYYLIFMYKYHFSQLNFYQKLIWAYKNVYTNKTSAKNYIKNKFKLHDNDTSYSPSKSPEPSPNLMSSLSKSIKSNTIKEIIRRNLAKYQITDDLLDDIIVEFYNIIKPIFTMNVYNKNFDFIVKKIIMADRFKNMMKLFIDVLNETMRNSRYSIQSFGKSHCVIKIEYNGKTKYIVIKSTYIPVEGGITQFRIYYYKKSLADVKKILS